MPGPQPAFNLSDRHPRLRLGAIVASCLILAAFSQPLSGAPAPQTRVRALPAQAQVRVGKIVTVDIQIRAANNVGSVPFMLVYDPEVLEPLTSMMLEGPFLKRDGSSTAFMTRVSATAAGALIVGHSRLRSDRGLAGKGTLCRLRFRALREGTSALSFVRASVLDPRAQPLQATFESSSIRVKAAK